MSRGKSGRESQIASSALVRFNRRLLGWIGSQGLQNHGLIEPDACRSAFSRRSNLGRAIPKLGSTEAALNYRSRHQRYYRMYLFKYREQKYTELEKQHGAIPIRVFSHKARGDAELGGV